MSAFCLTFGQQDKAKIFWNSLSTELVTKVPIADDESLENGQVQISVRFSGTKQFQKIGEPVKIEKSAAVPNAFPKFPNLKFLNP